MQRMHIAAIGAVLMLGTAVFGCGQRTQQASSAASDSLLASNPVEQPAGSLTPQSPYSQPEEERAPEPAPVSKPPVKKPVAAPRPAPRTPPAQAPVQTGVELPSGTAVMVGVNTQISSETAVAGDTWEGVVTEPVVIGREAPIPQGSIVRGVVTAVEPAEKGRRAFLVLAVKSVTVEGASYPVTARTDSIIAGSTRARNLGAIGGSAAAGALIGKAVGGGGKGALIGGLIGGAAATGAVAASKGYQVVLKEGTELVFTTNHTVVMK
ncbi:MAG: hypothetical protein A2W00_09015 [Candidatus Eisenbacteria bacterium RBG_16_71_46]|nr:MAG: hypothetical protein A2W00_09015 [Candidatus Eisenbacteria bacterium RBG_16_71_46]OGF21095.1 MAG: hypothetical protein A2V63_08825 [Candidatus Eisenbacteria bacterium RBG_19FT_COMBO_70_11]